jgi:hypothetical protein
MVSTSVSTPTAPLGLPHTFIAAERFFHIISHAMKSQREQDTRRAGPGNSVSIYFIISSFIILPLFIIIFPAFINVSSLAIVLYPGTYRPSLMPFPYPRSLLRLDHNVPCLSLESVDILFRLSLRLSALPGPICRRQIIERER